MSAIGEPCDWCSAIRPEHDARCPVWVLASNLSKIANAPAGTRLAVTLARTGRERPMSDAPKDPRQVAADATVLVPESDETQPATFGEQQGRNIELTVDDASVVTDS